MLPRVITTELDGQLGIQLPTSGQRMAILACGTSGTDNQPAVFTRIQDVIAEFTAGPIVEAGAYAIERYGNPVVFVKVETDTDGQFGTLAYTFAGSSTPSVGGGALVDNAYEVVVVFTTGGNVTMDGIKYRWSLDGGRTLSPITALGVSTTITLPDGGGIVFDLDAGTIVAGDTFSVTTTPPVWSASTLDAAIAALRASTLVWDFFQIVGDMDATSAGTAAAQLLSMHNEAKHHRGMGHYRNPDYSSETEAQYEAAFAAEFASFADTDLMVCAGGSRTLSSVSRRQYRQPSIISIAGRASALTEEVDLAEVDLGPLPGVQIRDANGNPDEHDEANNPGLDDDRATTLRTIQNFTGVYITNPRMMAPTGSDFVFWQFRGVMNIGRSVIDQTLTLRLSKAIRVNKKTGFILEQDARDIETNVNAALRTALLTKPKASDATFILSRSDNVLSTFALTGEMRIVPLAYPKVFSVTVSFNNPALRIAQV